MLITSKSVDDTIFVFINDVEIGNIVGTVDGYVLVEGKNNMKWKILYSNFI
jgi:hypothetical protein